MPLLPRCRAREREGQIDRLVARTVPARAELRRGRAVIVVRNDRAAVAREIGALGREGGSVRVPRRPVASRIDAPLIAQAQRNTCESAALAVLLAAAGTPIDQSRLQRALPRSGPADPQGVGPDRVWGDPDLGYVGRADGGGDAGGFGVYPGPVRRVAARFGTDLDDLTGVPARRVYERLLQGRAVMAWVGLSDGPAGEWRSPSGRRIRVNFEEHTVVLRGIAPDGSVRVSNVLKGTAETWSRERFESMWRLLGRRALGL